MPRHNTCLGGPPALLEDPRQQHDAPDDRNWQQYQRSLSLTAMGPFPHADRNYFPRLVDEMRVVREILRGASERVHRCRIWILTNIGPRISNDAFVRCVAPLGTGIPSPARRFSRTTATPLADPITITLREYQSMAGPICCRKP